MKSRLIIGLILYLGVTGAGFARTKQPQARTEGAKITQLAIIPHDSLGSRTDTTGAFLDTSFARFDTSLASLGILPEKPVSPYAWRALMELSVQLSHSAYSHNWSGQEAGSLSWMGDFHIHTEKQVTKIFRTEDEIRLSYGQSYFQSPQTRKWSAPLKSADVIYFSALWKYTPGWFFEPYVGGIFDSQFYDEYQTFLDTTFTYSSKKYYLNPMDITGAAGLSFNLYRATTGGATTRTGIALRRRVNRLPVDSSLAITFEDQFETSTTVGIEWVTDWIFDIDGKIAYTTRLSTLKPFFFSEAREADAHQAELSNWRAIDVNWTNNLSLNVISVITVNLDWQLIYDRQISPAGQLGQSLSVGINWDFYTRNLPGSSLFTLDPQQY